MKLFYLINEPALDYQVGYRQAIMKLIKEGRLNDCFFYSFCVKFIEFNSRRELLINDIIKEVAEFRPDAILFSHTGTLYFSDQFFITLKNLLGYQPIYALDERDVYGKYVKRLPKELLLLSGKCDITFLVCSGGWMFKKFQEYSAGRVVYLPHVCDDIHFGKQQKCTDKIYDIVMLGNLHKSSIPFNSMPGVRERIKVAEALYKRHGKKFAVFGTGWEEYPFSAGVVPFFEQEGILHCSNMSIGVDHFLSYERYFSDRLPISLYSGIPHLSWETPKLNLLFKEGEHIFYFNSVEESIIKADAILSGKSELHAKIKLQAVDLVQSEYLESVRMGRLINYINDERVNQ